MKFGGIVHFQVGHIDLVGQIAILPLWGVAAIGDFVRRHAPPSDPAPPNQHGPPEPSRPHFQGR